MTKLVPVLSTIKKAVKKAREKKIHSSSTVQKVKRNRAVEKRKHHIQTAIGKTKAKARKHKKPFLTMALQKHKKHK